MELSCDKEMRGIKLYLLFLVDVFARPRSDVSQHTDDNAGRCSAWRTECEDSKTLISLEKQSIRKRFSYRKKLDFLTHLHD